MLIHYGSMLDTKELNPLSSNQILAIFIECLTLMIACLGLGGGGCDFTVLIVH